MTDAKSIKEYEINEQMVDAGLDSYLGCCPDSGMGDIIDRHMIIDIFKAMIKAMHQDSHSPQDVRFHLLDFSRSYYVE